MLMDQSASEYVDFDAFCEFWKQYMYLYSETNHESVKFTTQSQELLQSTFDFITNISIKENDRPKYVFELDDLTQAKK